MTNVLNRRSFLAGALSTPWLASQLGEANSAFACEVPPTLDIHVHLFGVGGWDRLSNCEADQGRFAVPLPDGPVAVAGAWQDGR